MKPESQRLSIAAVHGWKYNGERGRESVWTDGKKEVNFAGLPDYLFDLNAMQSAVLAQSFQFQAEFNRQMSQRSGYRHQHTAAEWGYTFLHIAGKWVE